MELLFFLGQDTPLNVLSEPSHQKLSPPFINVHVKAGGVNVKDLEDFLLQDNDIYDDLVYLSIPTAYIEAYQSSATIKWLMWRIHNDMCHALICDKEMHDKLRNKSMLKWLHRSYVVKQLLDLSSPYAKVACDIDDVNGSVCCYDDTPLTLQNESSLYIHASTNALLRKSYAGCLLSHHKTAPAYLQCDFVGYKSTEDDDDDSSSPYVYKWPNFTLKCKRSLSSIMTSLRHIKTMKTVVVCKDLARPQTNEVISSLQQMLVPYTLVVESKTLFVTHHEPTLYLKENATIHNPSMFLSLLRKCPAFNTFSDLILHPFISTSPVTFEYNMINDSFVYLRDCSLDLLNVPGVLHIDDTKQVIAPLVYPMSSASKHSEDSQYYTSYFVDCLGDHDLADQMTEYASTIKAFNVTVNVYKDTWKQVKLKSYFQNIVYNKGLPSDNSFALSFQPTKHEFLFHSKIQEEASKFLSFWKAQGYTVVGIHFRRERLGVAVSNPCSDDYYRNAIEAAKASYDKICFVIGSGEINQHHHKKLLATETIVMNHEDEGVGLCILSMCDGLILSTSSYAWWAAALNKTAKVWCPRKWINTSHWYHSHDFERKLRLDDWVVIDEDLDE